MTADTCIRCKRITKIYAKKLCRTCYQYSRLQINQCSKQHADARVKRWREKNRNYWQKYYIRKKEEEK